MAINTTGAIANNKSNGGYTVFLKAGTRYIVDIIGFFE